MPKRKDYLGDGVYAVDEGYYIRLEADGDGGMQTIFIEPTVFYNLVEFIKLSIDPDWREIVKQVERESANPNQDGDLAP